MKIRFRRLWAWRISLISIIALVLLLAVPPRADADWKPSRDIEFVVPFGVGGGADLLARTLVKIIEGEQLVPVGIGVVNKPGGGTSVGVSYVASTKESDPHTIVLINPQTVLTPLRVPDARGWHDLRPTANLMLDDYLILARGDSRYATVADTVKDAKGKPDRTISIGSAGTADDMAIALLESATGIKLNIVRFNSGGQILTALLGGHIDLGAGNPLEFMGHLKGGDLKALGVMRDDRFPALPEVATLKEQGIQIAPFQMWRGIALPKNVADDAVAYWDGVMREVANTEEFKKYMAANWATSAYKSNDAFANFLQEQEKLYADMLKRIENANK